MDELETAEVPRSLFLVFLEGEVVINLRIRSSQCLTHSVSSRLLEFI